MPLENFGMIIPQGFIDLNEYPDPNGVPIYDKCLSNGPCACTGRCRRIIGYDTNPENYEAYKQSIEQRNQRLKDRLKSLRGNSEQK